MINLLLTKFRLIKYAVQAVVIGLACLIVSPYTLAQDANCVDGTNLQHTFGSGASWSLCATVSEIHGLEVSDIYYWAPGDSSRSVLSKAHVAQILLHYHDKAHAEPQISPDDSASSEIRQTTIHALSSATCSGNILTIGTHTNAVCERVENNRILAKYAQRPSLQSEAWELSSTLLRESLTWGISWTFTEDGQIRPEVSASGRATRTQLDSQFSQNERSDIPRLTRATILSTWRLVPALDTDSIDRIEQFDFPLDVADENRRPMQITAIDEEALIEVDRQQFRGWRIIDASGAGYYLDPANQGYSYVSTEHDWANYEIAFTRHDDCELYASENVSIDNRCGSHLNDFVNSESLSGQIPTMWYSQSRLLNPSIEDWPILSDVQIGFDLLPFDWTDTSPFEVVE